MGASCRLAATDEAINRGKIMREFYVTTDHKLNREPLELDAALDLAARHICVTSAQRAQIKSDYRTGKAYRWTISYGFATPVDINVEFEKRVA